MSLRRRFFGRKGWELVLGFVVRPPGLVTNPKHPEREAMRLFLVADLTAGLFVLEVVDFHENPTVVARPPFPVSVEGPHLQRISDRL